MKSKLIFGAVLCAGVLLSGCSVLRGGNAVGKDAVLPNDRETLHQPAKTQTYTSAELAKGLLKGDWTVETIGGEKTQGPKTAYIRFEPSEKRFYGNDGCNTVNGDYRVNPKDSTISFSNVLATMMACPDGTTDRQFNLALADASRYTWNLEGHDYHLTLLDSAGTPLMELVHCNFEFLTGAWHVVAINQEPVDVEGMDLVIDVDEGRLHGNTGCNVLNGALETDPEVPNSISFSRIATTRMTCPDIESETRLIVALEEAVRAKALGADKVQLIDNQGKPVVEMVRIDPKSLTD